MRRSSQQLLTLPDGTDHLYLRLYQKIRSLILSGAWPPGTRLPSSRVLARDLGISRNTAILALDHLTADGWIAARIGSGVYVSAEAPPARPPSPTPTLVRELDYGATSPIPFQISPGGVDLFPIDQWARLQAKVWRTASESALHEGSGAGWYPLRSAVAAHLHAVRGIVCDPEQVVIVSSSQSAIDLALRVLAVAGDVVWVEDPGYPAMRQALRANGLAACPVRVDRMGISVTEGMAAAPRARLAYVTPGCQFPTGAVMSVVRRRELLAWAKSNDAFVIEDDWDYNAHFEPGHPPEPLASLDRDRVVHIHSFNRLLFPGLRIAAIIAPEALVPQMIEARQAIDGFTNVANQIALAEFIQRGLLASHLRTSRLAHCERRAALHHAILSHMPDFVSFDPLQAGLHLVAYLKDRADAPLAAEARRKGFACSALSDFSIGDSGNSAQALLLGFASFTPEALDAATRALAEALFSHGGATNGGGMPPSQY